MIVETIESCLRDLDKALKVQHEALLEAKKILDRMERNEHHWKVSKETQVKSTSTSDNPI